MIFSYSNNEQLYQINAMDLVRNKSTHYLHPGAKRSRNKGKRQRDISGVLWKIHTEILSTRSFSFSMSFQYTRSLQFRILTAS